MAILELTRFVQPDAPLLGAEHRLGHAVQMVGDWAAGAGDQRALAWGAILLLALLAAVGRAAGSQDMIRVRASYALIWRQKGLQQLVG